MSHRWTRIDGGAVLRRLGISRAAATLALGLIIAPEPLRAQALDGAVARASATRVQPGDRLSVKIPREPQLSDAEILVNERGEAVFARIGTLPVADYTVAELRDTLIARYRSFLRDPAVDVTVLRRILVNGDVVRPGVYFVDVRHQLRDVLVLAGGVSGIGSRNKVFIVRGSQKIHVRDWEHDVSVRADLQSGDQIIVGRRNWFANNAMTAVSIAGLLTTIGFTIFR